MLEVLADGARHATFPDGEVALAGANALQALAAEPRRPRCSPPDAGEFSRRWHADLAAALAGGQVRFHPGSIRGAWPSVS